MSAKQELSKQAMILIIARGISFFLTLGIPLILVRHLTQIEFGAYKQSLLLYATAASLLPWGMSQSLYYFIPKEPQNRIGYLANSFLFLLIVAALSLIGFIFAGPALKQYFHSTELADCSPIVGLYSFFMIASIYCEVALISNNRAVAAASVILLNETVKALALIGGAIIFHSFAGVITMLAIAAAIRFLLLSAYFYSDLKIIIKGPNLTLFRKQWQYAMPFGLMVLVGTVHDYFHQYYISYSYSSAQFAIYAVGCLQLPLVDLFHSSIGDVAMVKMTEQLRDSNKVEARNIWHDAILKLAVIFIPLMIYLWLVGYQFITFLFTENYQNSVAIFKVILLEMITAPLLVDSVLRVFGETNFMLRLTVYRLPVTVFLVIFSLTRMGMIGAAASTVVVMSLMRIIALVRIRQLLQIGFKDLLPWYN
ncbi:MAG: oligosaccharide flippase family protein, partial [Acidobacteriota bacterium]